VSLNLPFRAPKIVTICTSNVRSALSRSFSFGGESNSCLRKEEVEPASGVEKLRGREKLGVRRCFWVGESDFVGSRRMGGIGPREERRWEMEPEEDEESASRSSNSDI
jgi:hypothetical protein